MTGENRVRTLMTMLYSRLTCSDYQGKARTLSSQPANQQRSMSRMSLAPGEMDDGARLGAWLGGKEQPHASLARGQAHWPCALGLRDCVKNCICSNSLKNAIRFFVRFYHQPLLLVVLSLVAAVVPCRPSTIASLTKSRSPSTSSKSTSSSQQNVLRSCSS